MDKSPCFKNGLIKEFFSAVKVCCDHYGSRSHLATEADATIKRLLDILEAVLSHGLRSLEIPASSSQSLFSLRQVGEFANSIVFGPSNISGPVLWDYVKKFLSRHELERYLILQHVFTDSGRGRAWLRTCLNEHSLGRYLALLISDDYKLANAYENFAFLRDKEKVKQLLGGIEALSNGILFALNIDKSELDRHIPAINKFLSLQDSAIEDETLNKLVATVALSPSKTARSEKPKKKPVKTVMTFDEEHSPLQLSPIRATQEGTLKKEGAEQLMVDIEEVPNLPYRTYVETEVAEKFETSSHTGDESAISSSSCLELQSQDGSILLPMTASSDPDSSSVKGNQVTYIEVPVELEEKIADLEIKLEKITEEKLGIEAELQAAKQSATDALSCYEIRIKTVNRENELLKAQLKKYVSAVQMLRRDGEQAQDTLERLKELNKIQLQQTEQESYEEKLVQVAEMHAELMEFNTRLQRCIQQKDALIRRLQDELIELRGPLPVDNGLNLEEDGFSIVSEDDGTGTGNSRSLINIWIPSAFLAKTSRSEHHVYQVYIRIRDEEWNIYRRFSQFFKFHKQLIKEDPLVGTFDFPPKKTVGNKDSKCVEDRRKRLQSYLRAVVNLWVTKYPELTLPDKETLLGFLSFFGDSLQGESGSRTRFGARFRGSQQDVRSATTPQYDGL